MDVVSIRDEDAPRALAVCVPLTTANRGSWYEVPIAKFSTAHAAFVLSDNFEGNTVNTAVTGWGTVTSQSGKTFTARVDPTDSGNLVATAGNTANSNEGYVLNGTSTL